MYVNCISVGRKLWTKIKGLFYSRKRSGWWRAVRKERCAIGGKKGCRSLNFLKPEESYISFQRLFDLYDGTSLLGRIIVMDDVAERISYVKKFVLEKTGFDCGVYLSRILTLDMLTLNNDRHFNNLGLISNAKTNSVYEAPIFDNGAGLLSDFGEFPVEDSLEENIARVKGKPFCASQELQAYHAGFGLSLDYDGLYRELAGEKESRALRVLKRQLEACRKLIPEKRRDEKKNGKEGKEV